MAPDPRCTAVAAAMHRTGSSYAQIAQKIGSTEQRVTDICTGNSKATDAEFQSLAAALGIANNGFHS